MNPVKKLYNKEFFTKQSIQDLKDRKIKFLCSVQADGRGSWGVLK